MAAVISIYLFITFAWVMLAVNKDDLFFHARRTPKFGFMFHVQAMSFKTL
ncbi:20678_t:CDS:2, partial [Dentiscutata erythropus]